VSRADAQRFRDLIRGRLGLELDDAKLDELAELLCARAHARRASTASAYLEDVDEEETAALAERLTVGETYFFRYRDQFAAFADAVLPAVLADARAPVRILSAGCATGEEAYSIAIVARERLGPHAPVAIHAFDVNPAALVRAERARYSSWALRETPAALCSRYFAADGASFALEPDVRSAVTFERRNLLDADAAFWCAGAFDVVFCRNVLMYFAEDAMRAVARRLANATRPGGFLFLGHAETLRGVSNDFHLKHTHGTFYYERKGGSERAPIDVTRPTYAPGAANDATEDGASWIDVIRGASERIARLASSRDAPTRRPAPPQAPSDRAPVIDMMREERFADALALLASFDADDPETRLLEAVLLTNAGKLREAERACDELLARDEMNAGAHYLKALCCEHAGDRAGALEHDRIATYLDPRFVMPHLHIGLLERRAGNVTRARAELEAALALLPSEDAARVLVFGGGFGRDGLAQLCRSELRWCGGAA